MLKDQKLDNHYGMTEREIADELGTSQQNIHDTLLRAIRKFKANWLDRYGHFDVELSDHNLISAILLHNTFNFEDN